MYIWLGCWSGLNKVVMELRKTQSRRTTLDDHVITLDNKDEWVLYSHCKNDDVPVCLSFTTFLYRTKLVQLLAEKLDLRFTNEKERVLRELRP